MNRAILGITLSALAITVAIITSTFFPSLIVFLFAIAITICAGGTLGYFIYDLLEQHQRR